MPTFELLSARALHAPNLRASFPLLEAVIAYPSDYEATLPLDLPASAESPAHLAAHLVLALQRRVGLKLDFASAELQPGKTALLLVQYEDEDLVHAALRTALKWLNAPPADATDDLLALQDLADRICLGPSTRSIVNAAIRRSIPYRRLNTGSMVQFGHGIRQRRIWAAETDRTGSIAETIAGNKALTKKLLAAVGLPTPEGFTVRSAEQAVAAAAELHGPVVVKPLDGNHGRGVFIGLTKPEEVESAYHAAHAEQEGPVLVERCVSGCEHRLLVIDGELAAATRGDYLYMHGDGVSTIQQLLDEMNRDPRRGESDDCPLSYLEFDPPTLAVLARQGFTPASIPPAGAKLLLQRNGNLATDVTDLVHPANARLAALAARTVGLDIAGIDVVVDDISEPIIAQRGAIVEVNAGPGLQMHLQPAHGTPRPVGEKIMRLLFPEGETGRIPVVAVLGDAALTRALAAALQAKGLTTGAATSEGLFVAADQLLDCDATSWERIAGLLMHPLLEAAVVQVNPATCASEGLPFDLCRFAIIDEAAPVEPAIRQAILSTLEPAGAILLGSAAQLPGELAELL